MWMTVGERRFAITLTDNAAARAFVAQLPLTVDMSELNGNEKHADLPKALPGNASRPGTIRDGDLMLLCTDTLVVFYSTFKSSYSYTRLGLRRQRRWANSGARSARYSGRIFQGRVFLNDAGVHTTPSSKPHTAQASGQPLASMTSPAFAVCAETASWRTS